MTKNHPEILALSNDAQAVLAGHWMLGSGATVTLQNQESRLSPRGAAAFAELIERGMLTVEKADDGYPESLTYRLTGRASDMEFRKSLKWMQENGKFSVTEPIPEAAR